MVAVWVQIMDSISGIPNGLEDHYADVHVNSGDDPSTSCRNLVRFRPVTPEFTSVIHVQQASISIGIRLTVFARWRHC